MGASLAVGDQAVLALEPLGALDAVELTQAGEILGGLGALVLRKVFGGYEIC